MKVLIVCKVLARLPAAVHLQLEMARAAKRPVNEPVTGLFSGPLTAQFYL